MATRAVNNGKEAAAAACGNSRGTIRLSGQTGRPGTLNALSDRAWAGSSAYGQAWHDLFINSCLNRSCLNGLVPGRAVPPVWPFIAVASS